MSPSSAPDRMIACLAERQHGLVARSQLVAAGLGKAAIEHRLQAGRLHGVHRGVYAVGHPLLAPHAREMAAVLACGPHAVISHRSAAVLWQMLEGDGGRVDVTVPRRASRERRGMRVHRSGTLRGTDLRELHGIPLTDPSRTVLDLAESGTLRDLERAVEQARIRRLLTDPELHTTARRAVGRRGAARLRTLLDRTRGPALTRSEAERRFLALVREARLPEPEVNVRVGRFVVDFLWRAQRRIVEVDGFRYHGTREAFERDRRRDAELDAAGYRVRRVTWWEIVHEPLALVAWLARALAPG